MPMARTLYWASQAIQRKGEIRRRLELLNNTQYWEPDRLRAFQWRKLQLLVRHAYDTVPYYRELMDRHTLRPEHLREEDDYRRLPQLSRTTLRFRADDLMSRTAPADVQRRQSSGSTGERVEFCQDRDFDLWSRAHQLRTYSWCGSWQLGEPFALVWGSPTYFETRSRTSRVDNRLSNRIELDAFRLDHAALDRLLNQLAIFQPRLISGYTTAIYLLARLARQRGVTFPELRAIQPNAEPLSDPIRTEIEHGFGCEVFDKYGSRETNIIAHESPAHDCLRIQAEHTYVEILDNQGHPCPPGKLGRLVVTTLNNHAMPLLRYQTTDLAVPLAATTHDGLGLPAMSSVIGRTQDILCTPDGGLIHPQMFSNVLRQFAAIDWFQVVQHEEDALALRVVTRTSLENETEQISSLICDLAGFNFRITFELLRDMPASSTGKFRLCVCDLPSNTLDRDLRALNNLRAQTRTADSGDDQGDPQ